MINHSEGRARWVRLLLIVPFIAMLWPPFYNFRDPELIGIPFFYWFQLAWILVTALITFIVYRLEPGRMK